MIIIIIKKENIDFINELMALYKDMNAISDNNSKTNEEEGDEYEIVEKVIMKVIKNLIILNIYLY